MRKCKWCQLARELSKDTTGHSTVTMCRPCYAKQRRLEALKKARATQKTR